MSTIVIRSVIAEGTDHVVMPMGKCCRYALSNATPARYMVAANTLSVKPQSRRTGKTLAASKWMDFRQNENSNVGVTTHVYVTHRVADRPIVIARALRANLGYVREGTTPTPSILGFSADIKTLNCLYGQVCRQCD